LNESIDEITSSLTELQDKLQTDTQSAQTQYDNDSAATNTIIHNMIAAKDDAQNQLDIIRKNKPHKGRHCSHSTFQHWENDINVAMLKLTDAQNKLNLANTKLAAQGTTLENKVNALNNLENAQTAKLTSDQNKQKNSRDEIIKDLTHMESFETDLATLHEYMEAEHKLNYQLIEEQKQLDRNVYANTAKYNFLNHEATKSHEIALGHNSAMQDKLDENKRKSKENGSDEKDEIKASHVQNTLSFNTFHLPLSLVLNIDEAMSESYTKSTNMWTVDIIRESIGGDDSFVSLSLEVPKSKDIVQYIATFDLDAEIKASGKNPWTFWLPGYYRVNMRTSMNLDEVDTGGNYDGILNTFIVPNIHEGNIIVALESAQFPGSFLDAGGNRQVQTVEKSFNPNTFRQWRITRLDNGDVALESIQFPGSYLDAGGDRNVRTTEKSYDKANFCKWSINYLDNGNIALASIQFPHSYLDAGGCRDVHTVEKSFNLTKFRQWKAHVISGLEIDKELESKYDREITFVHLQQSILLFKNLSISRPIRNMTDKLSHMFQTYDTSKNIIAEVKDNVQDVSIQKLYSRFLQEINNLEYTIYPSLKSLSDVQDDSWWKYHMDVATDMNTTDEMNSLEKLLEAFHVITSAIHGRLSEMMRKIVINARSIQSTIDNPHSSLEDLLNEVESTLGLILEMEDESQDTAGKLLASGDDDFVLKLMEISDSMSGANRLIKHFQVIESNHHMIAESEVTNSAELVKDAQIKLDQVNANKDNDQQFLQKKQNDLKQKMKENAQELVTITSNIETEKDNIKQEKNQVIQDLIDMRTVEKSLQLDHAVQQNLFDEMKTKVSSCIDDMRPVREAKNSSSIPKQNANWAQGRVEQLTSSDLAHLVSSAAADMKIAGDEGKKAAEIYKDIMKKSSTAFLDISATAIWSGKEDKLECDIRAGFEFHLNIDLFFFTIHINLNLHFELTLNLDVIMNIADHAFGMIWNAIKHAL